MPTSDRDADVAELRARQEIRDAVLRYCRGVDRLDDDLIASAFHPDAQIEHLAWRYTGAEIGRAIVDRHRGDPTGVVLHHVTNQLITLAGSSAGSEAYYNAWAVRPGAASGDVVHISVGRYLDTFERRAGTWKIARRITTLEAGISQRSGDLGFALPSGPTLRSKQDPSYSVLSEPAAVQRPA